VSEGCGGAPPRPRGGDRYCGGGGIREPLRGTPGGWLPRDTAQLDAYMRETLAGGNIVVPDTSRALARMLLYPPHWYLAWPAGRATQLLAIGTLPASIRRAYGFEWRARDVRAFTRWTALIRASLRLLPPVAREWPMSRRDPIPLRCPPGLSPAPRRTHPVRGRLRVTLPPRRPRPSGKPRGAVHGPVVAKRGGGPRHICLATGSAVQGGVHGQRATHLDV